MNAVPWNHVWSQRLYVGIARLCLVVCLALGAAARLGA